MNFSFKKLLVFLLMFSACEPLLITSSLFSAGGRGRGGGRGKGRGRKPTAKPPSLAEIAAEAEAEAKEAESKAEAQAEKDTKRKRGDEKGESGDQPNGKKAATEETYNFKELFNIVNLFIAKGTFFIQDGGLERVSTRPNEAERNLLEAFNNLIKSALVQLENGQVVINGTTTSAQLNQSCREHFDIETIQAIKALVKQSTPAKIYATVKSVLSLILPEFLELIFVVVFLNPWVGLEIHLTKEAYSLYMEKHKGWLSSKLKEVNYKKLTTSVILSLLAIVAGNCAL